MPTYPPEAPVSAEFNTTTDAILWYNVGIFGEIGYGIPNPSNDIGTLNPNIADFTNNIGRNLFAMMHREDVDMSTPPTIDTLLIIHQLVKRARQILAARTLDYNEAALDVQHITPAGDIFKVYPIPYFKVRNPWMKRWATYVLYALGEMFQHTQNRRTMEVYTDFGATVGKYLTRVYSEMATEMFGKTKEEVSVPGFLLTEEDFNSYDPYQFFTPIEMIDTVPSMDNVFTEDRKRVLSSGIPLTELPKLEPYPTNLLGTYARMRASVEGTVNPDTGLQNTTGDRTPVVPPFPTTNRFV